MLPDIDWTKPVQSNDGRAVRVLCTDRNFKHEPLLTVVVLIEDQQWGEVLASCTVTGYIMPGLSIQNVPEEPLDDVHG